MKTASGAIAVQIVWSSRRGSQCIEQLGSVQMSRGAQDAAGHRLAVKRAEQAGARAVTLLLRWVGSQRLCKTATGSIDALAHDQVG